MSLPDNKQLNIEFVQVVEEYPVLYNCNFKTSNENEQDKFITGYYSDTTGFF